MSAKVIYERFLWFHNKIKENKYPNARTLAEHFEVTRKTAQRDIDFMRYRLDAPLVYVHERRGYAYEDNTYELPGYWLGEEELTSLLLSYRLASAVPDAALKNSLRSFLDQVLNKLSHPRSISIKDLNNKVSVRNIAYSKTADKIYHPMLQALLDGLPLRIEYFSPHNDETTIRDILPLHLLQYMGTWHIVTYCALKNELRDFVLSRIKNITPCPNKINTRISAGATREYIRRTFGILHGKEAMEVCLRFDGDIANWITEQVWHPAQKTRTDPDGKLCLTIPVADFREIKREILKYGSQVEVLTPEALRKDIKEEIKKMKNIYS
ncbi:MAG: WYL domain-containing protein [Deltaproteobacteria bacterium]|nr:WYL domain-containing protein [Deltaproteobacteria bacterium]